MNGLTPSAAVAAAAAAAAAVAGVAADPLSRQYFRPARWTSSSAIEYVAKIK